MQFKNCLFDKNFVFFIDIRTYYYLQNKKIPYNKLMHARNTNQKKLILEIMEENYTHPTADEIYEKARAIDPHISRGTVYRNLAVLSENGSLLKISVPDAADHYDITLKNHYHFCCKNCQKMYDAPFDEACLAKIENITAEISKKMGNDGFSVDSHNLIFTGLCPKCSENVIGTEN